MIWSVSFWIIRCKARVTFELLCYTETVEFIFASLKFMNAFFFFLKGIKGAECSFADRAAFEEVLVVWVSVSCHNVHIIYNILPSGLQ